uniref:Uncharacterized protein n=1 Tax=Tanacetum cinerariifolium TaxID=118510 RepID=A0A6L2MNM8_TANCI|nr:hypothetical protein [Tanacetum cinerariifolium]
MVKESFEDTILATESSQPQSSYKAATTLTKFELKKILIDKIDKSKSYLAAPKNRECYKGLKKSYDLDKTIFSTYGKVYSLKRSQKDKDEDPSTGSDRGLKKRKTSKDAEPTKGPKTNESQFGSSKADKSQSKSSRNSVQLKEPEFEVADSDMSQDQEENPGNDDEEPKEKALKIWFQTFGVLLKAPMINMHCGESHIEENNIRPSMVKSYQKKINITKPETTKPDIRKKDTYTPYQDPQGFIYVDNNRRNRLMRSDELYKFSDRTLTRFRTSLDDITKNIQMKYLPKRRWSTLEKKRANIMIKEIDKQLKERRMMRSLEKSLPSEWNTHVVVWRNKPDLDTMSFDDIYNNFKIVEQEVKGTTSSSLNSQKMAFVSSPSSTNEVNTTYEKIGRKITINESDTTGYDKSKDRSRRTINVEDTSYNAMVAIDGAGFNWRFMADDKVPTNIAFMAFSDSELKTINGEEHIQALVDKKKVIIIETSVRSDLHLDDTKDKHVTTTSNDPLLSGEDRLKLTELTKLYTQLQSKVLALETTKANQALEIGSLKRRIKLEKRASKRTHKLKRLYKIGSTRRIESSDEASLGDQEDASRQGRMIDDLDADEGVALVNKTQGRNDQDMFDTSILDDGEVVAEKEVSNADPVPTTGEVVTNVGVEVSTAAISSQISMDEIILAKSLIDIKTSKPKAKGIMMQEPREAPTPTLIDSSQQPSKAKDKGKNKMIKPKKPLKRKDQIMIDEEVSKNLEAQLQAELENEERLARQKEKEANIALTAE